MKLGLVFGSFHVNSIQLSSCAMNEPLEVTDRIRVSCRRSESATNFKDVGDFIQ